MNYSVKWDLSQHCFDDFLAGAFLVLDEAIRSVDTQYNGVVLLTDCEGFGIAQFRTISVHRLRGIAGILQDSYPMRFKKIHVVNNPFLFTSVYYAIRPFLKKKMNERVLNKFLISLRQFLFVGADIYDAYCKNTTSRYTSTEKILNPCTSFWILNTFLTISAASFANKRLWTMNFIKNYSHGMIITSVIKNSTGFLFTYIMLCT